MWAFEKETRFREVKGGEGEESHCKRMLHILKKGHPSRIDHCILREYNSFVHCPGEDDTCPSSSRIYIINMKVLAL